MPLVFRNFFKIMKMLHGITYKNIIVYLFYFFNPAITNANGVNITYDANGWVPSWYLLAALIGIPIFCILLKLLRANVWIIGIIMCFLEIYFILINEFGFINHYSPILTHTFIRLLVYFFIGYLMAKHRKLIDIKNRTALTGILILLLVLFVFENCIIHYYGGVYSNEEVISTLPTSVCLVLYSFNHNYPIKKPIFIRNMSTFIYCSQVWPIEIIKILFKKLNISNDYLLLFASVIMLVILGYLVFTILIRKEKLKVLKYAV